MLRQYQTVWLVATALTSLLLPSLAGSKKQHESSGEVIVSADPVWNIRHILPPLDLQNNSVTDVKVNVGDVAYLPCRFPRVSSMHLVERFAMNNFENCEAELRNLHYIGPAMKERIV